jgi:L-lactate dehydrogenase complex protein LldG
MQTYKTSKSKENILSKIRKSLNEYAAPAPFGVQEKDLKHLFAAGELSPEEQFATAFTDLGGKFVYCEHVQEFIENIAILLDERSWSNLLCSDPRLLAEFQAAKFELISAAIPNAANESADACITGCEFVSSRTGTIVFSSRQNYGRTSPIYYPVHIVVVFSNQILPDLDDCIAEMKRKYPDALPSMINFNTGPSRTADIEKTLVVGVHGPEEVFCFYINEERY